MFDYFPKNTLCEIQKAKFELKMKNQTLKTDFSDFSKTSSPSGTDRDWISFYDKICSYETF